MKSWLVFVPQELNINKLLINFTDKRTVRNRLREFVVILFSLSSQIDIRVYILSRAPATSAKISSIPRSAGIFKKIFFTRYLNIYTFNHTTLHLEA